ncbi:hypothetical protein GZL_08368 [Streptomyces sp. 769]|nr:hypothetical protein GZL_08368 [Streptomyces sp. 769]
MQGGGADRGPDLGAHLRPHDGQVVEALWNSTSRQVVVDADTRLVAVGAQ